MDVTKYAYTSYVDCILMAECTLDVYVVQGHLELLLNGCCGLSLCPDGHFFVAMYFFFSE